MTTGVGWAVGRVGTIRGGFDGEGLGKTGTDVDATTAVGGATFGGNGFGALVTVGTGKTGAGGLNGLVGGDTVGATGAGNTCGNVAGTGTGAGTGAGGGGGSDSGGDKVVIDELGTTAAGGGLEAAGGKLGGDIAGNGLVETAGVGNTVTGFATVPVGASIMSPRGGTAIEFVGAVTGFGDAIATVGGAGCRGVRTGAGTDTGTGVAVGPTPAIVGPIGAGAGRLGVRTGDAGIAEGFTITGLKRVPTDGGPLSADTGLRNRNVIRSLSPIAS